MRQISRKGLIEKLDEVFSKYIRLRDCLAYSGTPELGKCFTCDKETLYSEANAGHFISRKSMKIRWSEENVSLQCVYCNKWLRGNYIEYTVRLQRKYSVEVVDGLIAQKHMIYKHTIQELEILIDTYADKLLQLSNQ